MNSLMSLTRPSYLRGCSALRRRLSLHSVCQQELQQSHAVEEENDAEALTRQQEIMKKRNKSRLTPEHYNRMHGMVGTIPEPNTMGELERDVAPLHEVREMFGRYGTGSGIEPRYLWPSKKEMMLMREYEQIVYPLSLPEMMAKAKQDREDSIELVIARQKEIKAKLKDLHKLKKEIREKIRKQEEEDRLEQEKRDQLIEEVRLMYGMRISPHDEKFQEILAQKAEEEKKAEKALKKQMKQQKLVEQMKKLAMAHQGTGNTEVPEKIVTEESTPQKKPSE